MVVFRRFPASGPREDPLAAIARRSQTTLRDRWQRLRLNAMLTLQTGCAAGLAWFLAHDLLRHPVPFFAPIAAVITLGVSTSQRLRRSVELVLGVAVGIAVGDILILLIGTGPAQITAVVTLAIATAIFIGGSGVVVTQSASSAVLIATLTPPTTGVPYTRFVDALAGGIAAFVVHALLLPLNPLTVVRRAAHPVFTGLSKGLTAIADALAQQDRYAAQKALEQLRNLSGALEAYRSALVVGRETVTIAPVRWRARGLIAPYVEAAGHIDNAVRNARVLARRALALLSGTPQANEPVPDQLVTAIQRLAQAVQMLRTDFDTGREPQAATTEVLEAVRCASAAHAAGLGFSGEVVVAQIRSLGVDLLQAAWFDQDAALRAVRRIRL